MSLYLNVLLQIYMQFNALVLIYSYCDSLDITVDDCIIRQTEGMVAWKLKSPGGHKVRNVCYCSVLCQ